MKKYKILFLAVVVLVLLFVFFTPKSSAQTELKSKQSLAIKAYCLLYPSRCVSELQTTESVVATTAKTSETKPEIKEIVVTTSPNLISWIRSLKSNKVETKLLCVEDVCVNKSQFLKMVQNANNESPFFTVSFVAGDGSTTTITR